MIFELLVVAAVLRRWRAQLSIRGWGPGTASKRHLRYTWVMQPLNTVFDPRQEIIADPLDATKITLRP